MTELKEKKDLAPICPHCSADLREIWFRELRGLIGRRFVYFCSHCRKVLGVSHRKGLLLGQLAARGIVDRRDSSMFCRERSRRQHEPVLARG